MYDGFKGKIATAMAASPGMLGDARGRESKQLASGHGLHHRELTHQRRERAMDAFSRTERSPMNGPSQNSSLQFISSSTSRDSRRTERLIS